MLYCPQSIVMLRHRIGVQAVTDVYHLVIHSHVDYLGQDYQHEQDETAQEDQLGQSEDESVNQEEVLLEVHTHYLILFK